MMSAVVIIPARYGSTRFPGKPLSILAGRPLIQHVYERAATASLADRVMVATDSERIRRAVESFGGDAVMTAPEHPSGTDRIAEAARGTDYDIIVNVQGDEPLIRGEMIDAVIGLLEDGRADMGTLAKRIEDPDEVFDPNVVKAVFDGEGFALYFSRAPVPFYRDEFCGPGSRESRPPESVQGLDLYKHLGIYSYRRDVLMRLTELPQSALERAERLEQLRALENGCRIKVGITGYETVGVDTPEDLARVEQRLREGSRRAGK